MVLVDAIARRLPGALAEGSGEHESFSAELDGGLEYPHYTRPPEFRGWKVPDVLLSGTTGGSTSGGATQSRERTRCDASVRSRRAAHRGAGSRLAQRQRRRAPEPPASARATARGSGSRRTRRSVRSTSRTTRAARRAGAAARTRTSRCRRTTRRGRRWTKHRVAAPSRAGAAPPPPRPEEYHGWNPLVRLGVPQPWRGIIDWIVTIVGAIAIVLAIKAWVVNPYRIPSSSMEPTLHCGSRRIGLPRALLRPRAREPVHLPLARPASRRDRRLQRARARRRRRAAPAASSSSASSGCRATSWQEREGLRLHQRQDA